jgi:hypothetical protein
VLSQVLEKLLVTEVALTFGNFATGMGAAIRRKGTAYLYALLEPAARATANVLF